MQITNCRCEDVNECDANNIYFNGIEYCGNHTTCRFRFNTISLITFAAFLIHKTNNSQFEVCIEQFEATLWEV